MPGVISRINRSVVTALGFCAAFLLASCGEEVLAPSTESFSPGVPLAALTAEFDQYQFLGFVLDDQGANDTPAQSDLNAFTRADNVSGKIAVKWVWDDVNSWTGSGQTGDACALFDTTPSTATKGKGMADFAVCVRISNPNGDPSVVAQLQAPASPLLYSCGDSKADRCASSIKLLPIGSIKCEVEKVTGENYFANGEDGADVVAACSIPLSAFSASATPNLINVCSFPSGSPNSNPFDCVVTPGAGFFTIKKVTTPEASGETFAFTINPAPAGGANHSLKDSISAVEQTALISAAAGVKLYSLSEVTIPANWTLDAVTCAFDRAGAPAMGRKTGSTIDSVSIESGETTVCTFTNSQVQGSIELKKVWSGGSGQTTLNIGTSSGGSQIATQLTGAAGAVPLTTGVKTVSPGTYYVSESGGLDDFTGSLACTKNGSSVTPGAGNALTVASGDVYVCTFTNTRNQGSIELKKSWSGTAGQTTLNIGTSAGGSQVASQLTGAAGAAPLTTGPKTVNTGTLYVSESNLSDYSAGLVCTSNGDPLAVGASNSVAVAKNAVVVCTFTNTRAQGSIELKKVWSGQGGQTTLKIGTTSGGSEVASVQTGSAGGAPLTTGVKGVNTGTYYVSEAGGLESYTPSLSCTSNGSPITPGTGNSVTVEVNAAVVCTFTNTLIPPTITVVKTAGSSTVPETGGTVTYSVVVTNTSPIAVTLSSLVDDKFGNLSGKGTCNGASNAYGSIAPGGTYSCTFPGTVGASEPGQTHINEVTATATTSVGNPTAKDTAKLTYTNVNPNISVTKSADVSTITAQGGTSVAGFTPDVSFARGAGTGGAGDPIFGIDICDDAGPNDQPAQVDMNCFSRADNVSGRQWLRWYWDDVNSWTGSGQTGDACALLDIKEHGISNGTANFALCVRISNPGGDPNSIAQVTGSPILYKCKDTAADRCGSKSFEQSLDATTVCTVSKVGEHMAGGDDQADVEAVCNLRLADLGASLSPSDISLLNVCSFPSGSPGSNPFDCVVSPAAGFLIIAKTTAPANSNSYFGFRLRNSANTANAAATNGFDEFAVQGGAVSAGIPMQPGTYSIAELLPTNWAQDSVVCTRGGEVIAGTVSQNVRGGVSIVQGQTTTCSFYNSLSASATVTFTIEVTNNGAESVTLFSLEDTENPGAVTPTYGAIPGTGCVTGGTIAGGQKYTCTFTRTVSGSPGFTHQNRVRAVAKDNENNSDTKISNLVTVTIN